MENYEKIIFKSAGLSTTESFLFTFIRIIAVIRVMIVTRTSFKREVKSINGVLPFQASPFNAATDT